MPENKHPSNSPNRCLAAILFPDVAGYTAMMQNNEAKSLRKVKHYRQVF